VVGVAIVTTVGLPALGFGALELLTEGLTICTATDLAVGVTSTGVGSAGAYVGANVFGSGAAVP
jgi:hypothetical protein